MSEAQRVEIIDADGLRDRALLDAWRALAVARGNPFLSPEWFLVAGQLIPEDSPYALAWWVGGLLCGVLPLVARRRGPLTVLRFPNARRGDWFGPACRPEDERAMGEACAGFLENEHWSALVLDRIDDSSAWPGALVEGRLTLAPRRRTDLLPFIALDEGGYEGYLAGRSRNFRSQLGRRRRKLEREHGLAFRMTASAAELEADLATFFRLHDERWSARGGSTFSTEHSRRPLEAFARETLELGWLRLWIAEADGEPAAAWYGWRVGERYCYALAGLAQRFEKHGLGNVLLAHTIEQAAAEGASIYDLMWGDEAYKERFATGHRTAGTWYVGPGQGARLALSLGVTGIHALESLPPGAREPLRRVKRRLRRS